MKHHYFTWFLFSIVLVSCIFVTGCQSDHKKEALAEQEEFDAYLDQIFCTFVGSNTLTLNYALSNPENYNIHLDKPTLGDFSIEASLKEQDRENEFLSALDDFDYSLLSEDQQLTYDLVKEAFSLDHTYEQYILYKEVLGPTTGFQAQLPILLAEYNFTTKEDIETYLALLCDVRRYMDQICEFEEIKSRAGLFMSDAVADSIIEQCEDFIATPEENYLITYFNTKIEQFDGLTEEQREVFKTVNAENVTDYVIPAYEDLIASLTSLKGTGKNDGGLCNYKNGAAYYEYLVKSETGSSRSLSELSELLDTQLAQSLINMAQILQSDPDVVNELDTYEFIKTDPEEILSYLKTAVKEDFPDLPDVDCKIRYVDESLQEHLSPAMFLVPQIDNYHTNVIYINANPRYDLTRIFPTIAHEGYPGHLYQNVYFLSTNPHPIRTMLSYLGYDEGWATYTELYSYSIAGLNNSVASILRENMIATHCIYSRADIGIHYEGWSKDEAIYYLSQFLSSNSCSKVYEALLEEPGIYLPYCIGYLEFMELRKTAETMLGDEFNAKEFHQFLLDTGPCSFDILSSQLLSWIKCGCQE